MIIKKKTNYSKVFAFIFTLYDDASADTFSPFVLDCIIRDREREREREREKL